MLHHLRKRLFINVRMLGRICGWLLIIEGVFLLVPTAVSYYYVEHDMVPLGLSAVLTLSCGMLLNRFSQPTTTYMGKRDGYLLTSMVWIVFSLFGMLPFLFSSTPLGITDSFFEAMSGFTTTGASVYPDAGIISHGLHIWRSMMQWIGGMGIILFTLAVLPMLNHSGGMQMFNAEVTGITHDKIQPRISQTAKSLWMIYLGLTLVLVLLLWAGPMNLFESVCHAFGAISTGGYAPEGEDVMHWSSSLYVKVVLTVFMFLGGVNFGLIFRGLRGDFKAVARNDAFRVYIGIIGGVFVVFVVSLLIQGKFQSWRQLIIDPLFQIVSTLTSTGFDTGTFESWGPLILALSMLMMFIGACAGSTTGGAKIDRIIYLFKNSRNELYRNLYPNAIVPVKINNRVVSPELVNKVVAFLCMYVVLVIAGGLIISAMGVPMLDSFFSAFSCMSNTGLDAGITGYGSSFATLPAAAKWVLTALMLTGRLEIFTILLLLTPAFWRR